MKRSFDKINSTNNHRTKFAFGVLSDNDFKFDKTKGADVLVRVLKRWLPLAVKQVGNVNLCLVEPIGSKVLDIVRKEMKGIVDSKNFKVVNGSVCEQKNCFAMGVGCPHKIGSPGENRNNVSLHKSIGKGQMQKFIESTYGPETVFSTTEKVYTLPTIDGNNKRLDGVEYILLVCGPNMNPERENCIAPENYTDAILQLEACYVNMFETYLNLLKEKDNNKSKRLNYTPSRKLKELNFVGLGTLPLGVVYPDESKRPNTENCTKLIKNAIQRGVEFIDTADTYGKDQTDLHYVEKVIGKVLVELDGDDVSQKITVATKAGMIRVGDQSSSWRMRRMSRDEVRKSIIQSFEALGGNRPIGLWQVHHIPSDLVQFQIILQEAKEMMEVEGYIERIGLCNCSLAELKFALEIVPISSVQNEYNAWNLVAELPEGSRKGKRPMCGILKYCLENDIMFIPHGVFGGLKARDGRRNLERDFPKATQLASKFGFSSVYVLCLAWMKAKWPNILHIPGARDTKHIEMNQEAVSKLKLLQEDSNILKQISQSFTS